jgi:hypothetical protein
VLSWAGPHSHMFVGYRAGAACSAYPTAVGGPGVHRAYECEARRARTIGRGRGDRRRHRRCGPVQVDPVVRPEQVLAREVARSGRGGLRRRSDRVRAAPSADCGRYRCVVVAPRRLHPPAGNRVKTDLAPTRRGCAAFRATGGCTTGGSTSSIAASGKWWPPVAVARELAGWCWSLAVLDDS